MICTIKLYPAYDRPSSVTGHIYSKTIIERELLALINSKRPFITHTATPGEIKFTDVVGKIVSYTVDETHFNVECDLNDEFIGDIAKNAGLTPADIPKIAKLAPNGLGSFDFGKNISPEYRMISLVLSI